MRQFQHFYLTFFYIFPNSSINQYAIQQFSMKNKDDKDKKFKPDSKPFKQNEFTSLYKICDEIDNKYFAKFFYEKKVNELNVFQAVQYNQCVLSDLSDQCYPANFHEIQYTYSTPQGFIFVTQPYEMNLQEYMHTKVIQEIEAMEIFQQCLKAVYSLFMSGFWHRNIRPQHFIKVKKQWKLESLVFSESYQDAQGVQSEYLWNPQYQPPQAYLKTKFSQDELENMAVWNMGSMLVDMLLGYHKLKDKSILDKYQNEEFSWKAVGVKKKFSNSTNMMLAKMLHYNPKKRMTLNQLFSDENICRDVARHFRENQKKARIYVPGQSHLSKITIQDRKQAVLTFPQVKKTQEWMEQKKSSRIVKKNQQKIQTQKEIYEKIKHLTEDNREDNRQDNRQDNRTNRSNASNLSQASNLQSIRENVIEENITNASRNRFLDDIMNNQRLGPVLEIYKCHHDKCQLMLICANKLEKAKLNLDKELLLLNKYAILFVSQMNLGQLTQNMNRNINHFDLQPDLWSEFQSSISFKAFKQILNFRYTSRKQILNEHRQKILHLKEHQRKLLNYPDILQFVKSTEKGNKFINIKAAYRKIVKSVYDIVCNAYNQTKNEFFASLGMYITFCMTVDKLYIIEDIPDNFVPFFDWMNLPVCDYVSLEDFQEYMDNADKMTLVYHSTYILKKYFSTPSFEGQYQDQYYYD